MKGTARLPLRLLFLIAPGVLLGAGGVVLLTGVLADDEPGETKSEPTGEAVTLLADDPPDPALHGKIISHDTPGPASPTAAVPAAKVAGAPGTVDLPLSGPLRELDAAMRRGDSAAVLNLWARSTAICVKGGPKGGLCKDSPAATNTIVMVEVIKVDIGTITAWPVPLAGERLKRWLEANPGTLVFAATWSPAGELALAYEIAPRRLRESDDDVVRYLLFVVDPSSATPLQTLTFMGDSPLHYWRHFNRPVSDLIGVHASLLAREAEHEREFQVAVATAIAQTTATAAAGPR